MPLRLCTGCKKRFPADDLINLPAGYFHTIQCAMDYAWEKNEVKTKKALAAWNKKEKAENKQSRDMKRRKLSWQHNLTQPRFNKLRVLEELLWFEERGLEPTCISCGREKGKDHWCCGHFKTVGAQSILRYDPMNSYLQHNFHCNMHLSGDIYGTKKTHGYISGLKLRFGEKEGQEIIDYCETHTQSPKWHWQQLEEMRADFNKQIRQLEERSQ